MPSELVLGGAVFPLCRWHGAKSLHHNLWKQLRNGHQRGANADNSRPQVSRASYNGGVGIRVSTGSAGEERRSERVRHGSKRRAAGGR